MASLWQAGTKLNTSGSRAGALLKLRWPWQNHRRPLDRWRLRTWLAQTGRGHLEAALADGVLGQAVEGILVAIIAQGGQRVRVQQDLAEVPIILWHVYGTSCWQAACGEPQLKVLGVVVEALDDLLDDLVALPCAVEHQNGLHCLSPGALLHAKHLSHPRRVVH